MDWSWLQGWASPEWAGGWAHYPTEEPQPQQMPERRATRRWEEVGRPAETSTGAKLARRQLDEPPDWDEHMEVPWPGSMNATVPAKGQPRDWQYCRDLASAHGCDVSLRLRGTRHQQQLQHYMATTGSSHPGGFVGNRGYRLTILGPRPSAVAVLAEICDIAESLGNNVAMARNTQLHFSAGRVAEDMQEALEDAESEQEDLRSSSSLGADFEQDDSQGLSSSMPSAAGSSTALVVQEDLQAAAERISKLADDIMDSADAESGASGGVSPSSSSSTSGSKQRFLRAAKASTQALAKLAAAEAAQLSEQMQSMIAHLEAGHDLSRAPKLANPQRMLLCVSCLRREYQLKNALPLQILAALPFQGVALYISFVVLLLFIFFGTSTVCPMHSCDCQRQVLQ